MQRPFTHSEFVTERRCLERIAGRLRAPERLCEKRRMWRPRSAVQRASRSGGNRFARRRGGSPGALAAGVALVNRDGGVVSDT
jgi:hypothetical protein